MTLSDFVKTFLVPGSLPFLFLGLGIGVILLYVGGRWIRWGRRWLTALLLAYWLMSLPIVAAFLWRGLASEYTPLRDPTAAKAVVVLTGGVTLLRNGNAELRFLGSATAARTLETYRLYQLLGDPLVVVSGGDPTGRGLPESESVRLELIRLGIPEGRVIAETQSRNTREHALYLPPLLKRLAIEQFVLVTSATEMYRQQATLKRAGLKPIPSPPPDAEPAGERAPLLPSLSALTQSRNSLLGYLGLVYYWWNGWL